MMKKPLAQIILTAILLVVAIGAYGTWFIQVDSENA
jgi:hypothetical protein